jgi:hypothetical protein
MNEHGRKEQIVRGIAVRLTGGDLLRTELFIDGEWTAGCGNRVEVREPATGDVLARQGEPLAEAHGEILYGGVVRPSRRGRAPLRRRRRRPVQCPTATDRPVHQPVGVTAADRSTG